MSSVALVGCRSCDNNNDKDDDKMTSQLGSGRFPVFKITIIIIILRIQQRKKNIGCSPQPNTSAIGICIYSNPIRDEATVIKYTHALAYSGADLRFVYKQIQHVLSLTQRGRRAQNLLFVE